MRRRHSFLAAMVFAGVLTNTGPALRAESLAVPVVIIEAPLGADAVGWAAALDRAGVPVLDSAETAAALGPALPFDESEARLIDQRLDAAEDDFFSDRYDAARPALVELAALTRERAGDLGRPFAPVHSLFKSFMYLAVIAADEGAGPGDAVRWIDEAAAIFSGKAPEVTEFPPWLCQLYAERSAVLERPLPERSSLTTTWEALRPSGDDARVFVRQAEEDEAAERRDLLLIAQLGSWKRLLAISEGAGGARLLLVDVGAGGIARSAEVSSFGAREIGEAVRRLSTDTVSAVVPSPAEHPWYRDGLGWTLTGLGLAAATTGILMGYRFGRVSSQEPWVWGLIAAGAGVGGTGIVLFFLPSSSLTTDDEKRAGAGYSLALHATF